MDWVLEETISNVHKWRQKLIDEGISHSLVNDILEAWKSDAERLVKSAYKAGVEW